MYSTCLHCTKSLGTNQVLETLPIGRRVAFDAAKGRLWVVCRACARWNLVPFDTRLESIDACERLYRDTPTRYATDNIGLARTKEGLELVRIGQPLRPEFASWRYGDSFGRRRRRNLAIAAGTTVGGLALYGGAAWLGVGAGVGSLVYNMVSLGMHVRRWRDRGVPIPDPKGTGWLTVPQDLVAGLHVERDADHGWALRGTAYRYANRLGGSIVRRGESFRVTGAVAERALVQVMPRLNATEGRPRDIRDALELIEARTDVIRLLTLGPSLRRESDYPREIGMQPAPWRLAAEMALHERREGEALEGELKLLEREWREAEKLAKISDDLTLVHQRSAIGDPRSEDESSDL